MTRSLGALSAGLLALALGGCATASGPGALESSRASAGSPVAGSGDARLQPANAPSADERDPDRLRDLQPEAVARLIGTPHYVRREGGATIWQFHAGACVMDLFWYPAAEGPRLVHYEVRGVRLASAAEAADCFGDLLVRRRDAVTS